MQILYARHAKLLHLVCATVLWMNASSAFAQGDAQTQNPVSPPLETLAPKTPPVETPVSPDAQITPAPNAAPAAEQPGGARSPAKLTIATWGGAYAQSQAYAIFEPYEKATGDKIEAVRYDGSLGSLEQQAARNRPEWDLVDVGSGVAAQACDSGLLEPLDASGILGGADAGTSDFIPGAIKPCAIGSVAWSAVMLYNKNSFTKRAPASLKDMFDLKAFPGKRALVKSPKYNLELALMADGVDPAEVYTTLATPDGLTRALKKLDQIKTAIVWSDKPSGPVAQVGKGDAAIGVGFNGRAFNAIVASRQPVAVIWDGQVFDIDYWAIPKGSKNANAAKEFIRFATAPERLAAQTRFLPYGPVRVSALAEVGKHSELDIDMKAYLPTEPGNFKRALRLDETWWVANEATVAVKFNAWLAGEPFDAAGGENVSQPTRN